MPYRVNGSRHALPDEKQDWTINRVSGLSKNQIFSEKWSRPDPASANASGNQRGAAQRALDLRLRPRGYIERYAGPHAHLHSRLFECADAGDHNGAIVVTDSLALSDHCLQAAFRYLEKGQLSALQEVIRFCPEIIEMRDKGRGMIHAAAIAGRVDLLVALLDFGADLEMREGEWMDDEDCFQPGYLPLQHAARYSHLEAVSLLLVRGANASSADYFCGTPLHAARNAEVAEALLNSGADPNANCLVRHFDEALGWHFIGTPLHNAGNNAAMIQTLVNYGAKVDAVEPATGRTPLHFAAALGLAEAAQALLSLGPNPNARCEISEYAIHCTRSPLHYAAENGHEGVVEILLQAGAKANAIANYAQSGGFSYQLSPLHFASREGHEGVVKLLLQAGTRPSLLGGMEKKTAAEMARAARHQIVASILGM